MAHNSISLFTVLQWNIRSIRSNYNNLQILIKDFDPDVIALTETFLKFENTFTIPGYKIIREEAADGYGGLAIAIKYTQRLCLLTRLFCRIGVKHWVLRLTITCQ